jgi:hypothetical protein
MCVPWSRCPPTASVRGNSKSAVSKRLVYVGERKLAELMSRELGQLSFTALSIDGVHFGEHVVLAAVGVDDHGEKHVLGLREGAEENSGPPCNSTSASPIPRVAVQMRAPSHSTDS